MRFRLRWSLTIDTARPDTRPGSQPATAGRATIEATDGGQFETDGQPDAGELIASRLERFVPGPRAFGFSKRH